MNALFQRRLKGVSFHHTPPTPSPLFFRPPNSFSIFKSAVSIWSWRLRLVWSNILVQVQLINRIVKSWILDLALHTRSSSDKVVWGSIWVITILNLPWARVSKKSHHSLSSKEFEEILFPCGGCCTAVITMYLTGCMEGRLKFNEFPTVSGIIGALQELRIIQKHALATIPADPASWNTTYDRLYCNFLLTDPSPRLRLYAMLAFSGSNYVVAAVQTLAHQEGIPSTTTLALSMTHSRTSSTAIRAFGSSRSSSLTRTA